MEGDAMPQDRSMIEFGTELADYLTRFITMTERLEESQRANAAKVRAAGGRVLTVQQTTRWNAGFEVEYRDMDTGELAFIECFDDDGDHFRTDGEVRDADAVWDELEDDDLYESLDDPLGVADWINELDVNDVRSLLALTRAGLGAVYGHQ